jgi:hypothetical protein
MLCMKEYITAYNFFFMCGGDLNGRCIVIFYEQEHGRRWSGWRMETKKIFWPAS